MTNLINVKIKSQFLNIVILGFLLTVAGIILIVQAQYAGIAPVVLGLLILSIKKGILIDVKNKKIKYYKKIAFKIFGNWEECNDIKYIALTRVKLTQQMYAVTVPGTYTDVRTKLSFINSNNKATSIITDKKSKLMPVTQQIAKGFNVDIFDNSEGKKEWIKIKNLE